MDKTPKQVKVYADNLKKAKEEVREYFRSVGIPDTTKITNDHAINHTLRTHFQERGK